MRREFDKTRGFTLIELLVSMSIGLIVLGAGLQVYSETMKATFTTSERSEMQSDFRAAANILQRDISMAGAGALGQQGLATSTVGLPSGTGATAPVYPCSTTSCNYINGAPVAYPGSPAAPLLYSIIPGYNLGITVNATEGPTDIITVSYADVSLPLNCYTVDVVSASEVIFELPTTLASNCVLPTGVVTVPALNSTGIGLQAGDYILFNTTAVGIVSNVTTASTTSGLYSAAYEVTFATGDPGHINQPTITTGTLDQLSVGVSSTLSAVRLMQILSLIHI